jgi:hypothetical protein
MGAYKNFINRADISFSTRIVLLLDFCGFAVLNYYKCRENVEGIAELLLKNGRRISFRIRGKAPVEQKPLAAADKNFPLNGTST